MEGFLIIGGGAAAFGVACLVWIKLEDLKYGKIGNGLAVATA